MHDLLVVILADDTYFLIHITSIQWVKLVQHELVTIVCMHFAVFATQSSCKHKVAQDLVIFLGVRRRHANCNMQYLQGQSNVRGVLCQIPQHNRFDHTPREPPSTKKQQENQPKYQEQANSKQPNVKTAAATISNPIQQAINKTMILAKYSANTKSNS